MIYGLLALIILCHFQGDGPGAQSPKVLVDFWNLKQVLPLNIWKLHVFEKQNQPSWQQEQALPPHPWEVCYVPLPLFTTSPREKMKFSTASISEADVGYGNRSTGIKDSDLAVSAKLWSLGENRYPPNTFGFENSSLWGVSWKVTYHWQGSLENDF